MYLGWLEWIIRGKMDFDHEHAACIWTIARPTWQTAAAVDKVCRDLQGY